MLASAAGSFDASWWPVGRGMDDNLVVLERNHDEAATLRRFDLDADSIVRSYTLVGEDVSMAATSPNGSRLYYITNDYTTLRQFDLMTEREIVLYRAAEDERLWLNTGRQPAEGMLAFTGPAIAGRPRYERLLLLQADEPEQPTTIAHPGDSELVAVAVPCSDGRIIYAVEQDAEWAVRIWEPDGTTRTMFTASTYVIPWACR